MCQLSAQGRRGGAIAAFRMDSLDLLMLEAEPQDRVNGCVWGG